MAKRQWKKGDKFRVVCGMIGFQEMSLVGCSRVQKLIQDGFIFTIYEERKYMPGAYYCKSANDGSVPGVWFLDKYMVPVAEVGEQLVFNWAQEK